MKTILLATAAVVLLAVGSASAADIRAPAYKAPPPPPPPPLYNWSGCFIGVAGGGAWGQSKHVSGGPLAPGADITDSYNLSGGIIGGTWGCNYQVAPWTVIGTESDFSWTNKRGSATDIPPFAAAAVPGTKEHWLSTTRVRAGISPVDRWLLYVTGGLAAARVEATVDFTGIGSFSDTKTRWGWTVGAGTEYALGARWSVKFDYLYVRLN